MNLPMNISSLDMKHGTKRLWLDCQKL